MIQTLITLPAITSPITVVQANPLSQNIAKIQNLSNLETLALSVISKIRQLNAAGGTNYISNHKQLRMDAANFMGAFVWESHMQGDSYFNKMRAVIDWNAADTVDASFPNDVNALVTEMGAFRVEPETMLMKYYLFLLYKLHV